MKCALLIAVLCLLASFSGRTVLGQNQNWLDKLLSDVNVLQQKVQVDAQKLLKQGQAQVDSVNRELDIIKQKCASKENKDMMINQNGQTSRRVAISAQDNNGFRHFFEQTINPVTNKIEGRHFAVNLSDPNAEPICDAPVVYK